MSTTMIIHSAWRLDFNLSLASFEPNIRSTRNLIDLALASPHTSNLRFLFASSISSVQAWGQSRGAVPEDIPADEGVAVGSGYGEGKYVAERVIRSVIYQRKHPPLISIPRSSLPRVACKLPHSELVRFVVACQTELGRSPTGCLLSSSQV